MDNWEQYQTAYQAADQKTKDIIHSSLIPECVSAAVLKYELDDSHIRTLIQLFANKTVGLADETQTINAIRSAGIPASSVVYNEITKDLETNKPTIADTSLVQIDSTHMEARPVTTNVKIQSAPAAVVAVETPVPTTRTELAAELAETEAAFSQLQPIRTMAHDMQTLKQEQEPVHQSASQETLLEGQGNAQKNHDASWGTGQ